VIGALSVWYLGLDICVVVDLEQQGSSLGVVLPRGDVERREPDLSFSVILQEQRDHLFMSLLQRHRKGREAILQ
jgi:hypothetical protein